MKKLTMIFLLVVLCSGLALAADNQTKISLSMGNYTGAMGFVFEQTMGLPAVYTGFGITPETFRVVAGGRIYMPDQSAKQNGATERSNVFIGPVAGVVWKHLSKYDSETNEMIYLGNLPRYWGGVTGGYDFNWGQYDEYHLTIEGGMGFNIKDPRPNNPTPYMPIFNVSLGYSF